MKNQNGFGLITAVFILLILASLAAMMSTLVTNQRMEVTLDSLGMNAYGAAQTGIEWGVYQTLQNGAFATDCQGGSVSQVLPTLPGQLAPFTVTVSCTSSSASEVTAPAGTVRVYKITSTANGINGVSIGKPDYVERQLEAVITQ